MKVYQTPLEGVVLFEPRVYGDERGFFLETWRMEQYHSAGISEAFVQDNHSRSEKGVLRGLHFQLHHPQGKLVSVIRGEIFDVAVDIRQGSPTFGQWHGTVLSDKNHFQLYIPPGFAHGFCVTSDIADVYYKCTDIYYPDDEGSIIWNDPDINIRWPCTDVTLSKKDSQASMLAAISHDKLPVHGQ